MSNTFTEQMKIIPPTATPWTADGEGMHSMIPFDLVRGLNNLGTYVNNHMHYVQNSLGGFWAGSGSSETLMTQIPVLAPLWAVRMPWVIGAKCLTVGLTSLKVYLAKDRFAGATSPFNTAAITPGYSSSSIVVSLAAGSYGFADGSASGIVITPDNVRKIKTGQGTDTKYLGWALVTATGGAASTYRVYDSSVWFLPS